MKNSRSIRVLSSELRLIYGRPAMIACVGTVILGLLGSISADEISGKLAARANRPSQTVSESAKAQNVPGAGNQRAIELGRRSPMIQSAFRFLVRQAETVKDPK